MSEDLQFEWDDVKARLNEARHQVTFQEAESVFQDPYALVSYDLAHSDDEPRRIILGYSKNMRLLYISFTERRQNVIRIISARKATPQERKTYEKKTR
ncbi:MAG TPA: BrnT family toxin [Anaerolineae bacterium]|nr:BrnT family toxin [Anaerolineae bacterium]